MRTAGAVRVPDSRQRFIDVAVRLFARHSFAGTSLQMIADELGVTKAAVYHHFRTREDLLAAVVAPLVAELSAIIAAAEAQRTPPAQAEHMLVGFVEIVVRNRELVPVLALDPGARELLRTIPDVDDVTERQIALLAATDPGPTGLLKATVTVAGLASAVGIRTGDLDDDLLGQQLLEIGRRILGLRAPRRAP
jgi:AcrR family transcriptional regulator